MKFTADDRKEIHTFLENFDPKLLTEPQAKAIPIIDIDTISERTWLFIRSVIGIGGSEDAGLEGCSPYTNPVHIFKSKFPYLYNDQMTEKNIEKIIKILEDNNKDKDYNTQFLLDYGHYMEDFIANQFVRVFEDRYKDDYENAFKERTGEYKLIDKVEVYKDPILYKHASAPIFADFDYRIRIIFEDGTVKEGIFECKTASSYKVKANWEEGFPVYYNTQVRHYMAIADVDFFVIACVADNSATNFFAHLGFRDFEYENEMLKRAYDFWYNSVMTETVPAVPDDVDALDDLLSLIDTETVKESDKQLGRKMLKLLNMREELLEGKKMYQAQIKALEHRIATVETQILENAARKNYNRAVGKDKNIEYKVEVISKKSQRFEKAKYLKLHPTERQNVEACTNVTVKNGLKITKSVS